MIGDVDFGDDLFEEEEILSFVENFSLFPKLLLVTLLSETGKKRSTR